MRKSYPSNISQEQFEKIRLILESSRKKQNQESLRSILWSIIHTEKWLPVEKGFSKMRKHTGIKKCRRTKSAAIGLKKTSWKEQWSERANQFLYN